MALHGTLADEAAVLRVRLTALEIGPKQVVHAFTKLGLAPDSFAGRLAQLARDLRSQMANLDEDTLEDFLAKNKEAHPVAPAFVLDGQLIPLSDEDRGQIFCDSKGWDRFRAAYPESSGHVDFSRVGFNAALTQALIYVGMQAGSCAGLGAYSLLEKDGTTWKETAGAVAWIS